ncbi:MAG: protein kinase [Leptolyngbyaceae cyanobacterium MO_188.B28]|nr:protein kinase [Leptolyngbyaceae cyanobacterium MO_188.B28]
MNLPLSPSTQISNYQIQHLIGQGTFSRVYHAIRTSDPQSSQCALLELALEGDAEEILMRQQTFTRMAEILATLDRQTRDHPVIPRVYAFFEEGGRQFVAQELIEGVTYADYLNGSPLQLSVAELEQGFFEALSGLAELQRAKIVHRDIKPANLMRRDRDGSTVIIDFGAACDLSQMNAASTVMVSEAAATLAVGKPSTKPGYTRIYTPGYAHPDQRDGLASATPQWDLYALAKTFVALRLGSNPPWRRSWSVDRLGYSPRMQTLLREMLKVEGCRFVDADDALAFQPTSSAAQFWRSRRTRSSTLDSGVQSSRAARWMIIGCAAVLGIAAIAAGSFLLRSPNFAFPALTPQARSAPGCPNYVSSAPNLPAPNRGFAARFRYPDTSAHGDSKLQVWRQGTLIAENQDFDIQGFIWIKSMAAKANFPLGDYTLRLLIPGSAPYEQEVTLSEEFPFHYMGRVTALKVTCDSQSKPDSPAP